MGDTYRQVRGVHLMKCGIVDSLCYMDGLSGILRGENLWLLWTDNEKGILRRVFREGCRRAMKKLVPRVSSSRFWRDPGNEVGVEYLTSFPFIVMLFYF